MPATSLPASPPPTATSGEGRVVRRAYDATDAMVELVEPVATGKTITTTFGYNATGEMTRSTDGRGNTVWTTYNSLGLPESTVEPATQAHPQPADRTWTTAYDAGGNVTSVAAPGGVRVDRKYDHLGRLTKETGAGAQVATPERTYGYDQTGRLTSWKAPDGNVTTYEWDDSGNRVKAGAETFSYDERNLLRRTQPPGLGRGRRLHLHPARHAGQ